MRRAAASPSVPGRLNSAALAFSAATWLFAEPLYGRIVGQGVWVLLPLILVVQMIPALGFFVVDRTLARYDRPGRWLRAYRTMLMAAALMSLLRLIHLRHWPGMAEVSGAFTYGLILATAAACVGAGVLGYRFVQWSFIFLAPLLIFSTGQFVHENAARDAQARQARTAADAARPTTAPGPVFVIIFDELTRDVLVKNGEVDGARFPNFKALAARGAWFTDATSNYWLTCLSVPSLLTGRAVSLDAGGCAAGSDAMDDASLFGVLARRFRVSIYEEYLNNCLSPAFTCYGVSYLAARYPHVALINHLVPLAERPGLLSRAASGSRYHAYTLPLFRTFLNSIRRDDAAGRAYYYHALLPHFPYQFNADGTPHGSPYRSFTADGKTDALTWKNYEQQTMFVDRLLGNFLDRLRRERLLQRATIIVTSDHGPGNLEDVRDGRHPEELSPAAARVPLLIAGPGVRPQVVNVDYQHVDFLATVADVLGVGPPAGTQGVSAFAADRPVRPKVFFWRGGRYLFDRATGALRLSESDPAHHLWQLWGAR
ncbi:MAG: sulfatase-like hydrolase/transferase [Armatimonadetes bacterium]|nr:sulfatase-like hydrolase/transferase [Armatimonadota bacterium]